MFLLHCPSLHSARPLAGILLYGARTFLDTLPCRGCLADFRWQLYGAAYSWDPLPFLSPASGTKANTPFLTRKAPR